MARPKISRTTSGFAPGGQKSAEEFETRVLDVARVARVVAGGRRFRFRVLVVYGDRKGRVGVGLAKGKDVAAATEKASAFARKHVVTAPLHNETIPREITMKYKSVSLLLRPAPQGRGIIAGGAVRAVCELAGIKNVSAKILSRSSNAVNAARATLIALEKLGERAPLWSLRRSKNGVKEALS